SQPCGSGFCTGVLRLASARPPKTRLLKMEAWELGALLNQRGNRIMQKLIPIFGISILAVVAAKAQNPAQFDPEHYKVLLDNEYVRVLDVRLKPGEKTPIHSHPNLVVYSLTGGAIKSTTADGKTTTVTTKAGRRLARCPDT